MNHNDSNLTTEDMIVVATTFQDAHVHVLHNYLVPEERNKLLEFVANVILRERPYMLVTQEGIKHAIDLAFKDDLIRDFVLKLSYVFFARYGNRQTHVHALAANLARGAAMGIKHDYAAIPDQIRMRLPEPAETTELLENNPWLMVILMIQLFIQLEAPTKKN